MHLIQTCGNRYPVVDVCPQPFLAAHIVVLLFAIFFLSETPCFAPLGACLFFYAKRKGTKRKGARPSRPWGERCDARQNRRT
ncbi:MAG: hypothetical protein KZQ89_21060 [Candidatus Thiodiazotropha sp. (ex Lucinoma kastoroae)]|nr:hypothetical protein [Candidatus Thiodiazotropha sp. (ex Lucinoma kastoroae)]